MDVPRYRRRPSCWPAGPGMARSSISTLPASTAAARSAAIRSARSRSAGSESVWNSSTSRPAAAPRSAGSIRLIPRGLLALARSVSVVMLSSFSGVRSPYLSRWQSRTATRGARAGDSLENGGGGRSFPGECLDGGRQPVQRGRVAAHDPLPWGRREPVDRIRRRVVAPVRIVRREHQVVAEVHHFQVLAEL